MLYDNNKWSRSFTTIAEVKQTTSYYFSLPHPRMPKHGHALCVICSLQLHCIMYRTGLTDLIITGYVIPARRE